MMKYSRIRDIRIDKDFTQAAVAKYLKIAQNTLSQYETGERNIPNEILVKMAIFYDTSIDYLLGLTEKPTPYPRRRT